MFEPARTERIRRGSDEILTGYRKTVSRGALGWFLRPFAGVRRVRDADDISEILASISGEITGANLSGEKQERIRIRRRRCGFRPVSTVDTMKNCQPEDAHSASGSDGQRPAN
jgi:hypothetical protein